MTEQELQTLRNMGNEAEAAADEIERNRAAIVELVVALEKCLRRSIPHQDDADADRVRDLLHIEVTSRAAIAKHEQPERPISERHAHGVFE